MYHESPQGLIINTMSVIVPRESKSLLPRALPNLADLKPALLSLSVSNTSIIMEKSRIHIKLQGTLHNFLPCLWVPETVVCLLGFTKPMWENITLLYLFFEITNLLRKGAIFYLLMSSSPGPALVLHWLRLRASLFPKSNAASALQ